MVAFEQRDFSLISPWRCLDHAGDLLRALTRRGSKSRALAARTFSVAFFANLIPSYKIKSRAGSPKAPRRVSLLASQEVNLALQSTRKLKTARTTYSTKA